MKYFGKLAGIGRELVRHYGKILLLLLVVTSISVPGVLFAAGASASVDLTPETVSDMLTIPEASTQGGESYADLNPVTVEAGNDAADAAIVADAGEGGGFTTAGVITAPLNFLITSLAALFNYIAMGVALMILTLIKMILIPILSYDGFATSRIITLGWSLVRDVVNMFVVVVLLVIAVMTIVGSQKANWEQQIPRLFIYVIAVNFSRTICGLLLDVGNVIMFQFVNAILDVGAGNFAQLLKLNISGTFADIGQKALEAPQMLASAYLQLALLLAVLAVIGIMVLVFLYRIVVLWVLIIMSPAAFFLGGIKDVLGQAGSAYNEWWKKFSSAIILGPMLTFFLWLALAAASTGDIISSENFPTGEATETMPGLVLQLFDMSQLSGLFLGLVLLVVGMQQASSAAGSLGGVAASFINEGMGMRIVKGAIRMPAQQLGRQFNKGLSPVKGGTLTGELGKQLIASGQTVRSSRLNTMTGGLLGATYGRALSEGGSVLQGFGDAQLHESQHNADERVKGWSKERLASELALVTSGEGAGLLSTVDAQNSALKRLVTEKSTQDTLEAEMVKKHGATDGAERFQNAMRSAIGTVEHHESHILGDNEKDGQNFNDTKTRFVHLLGEMRDEDGTMVDASTRQRRHMDHAKFDANKMSTAAIRDEGIQNIANTLIGRVKENGDEVSKLDEWKEGKGISTKLHDALLQAPNRSRQTETALAPWVTGAQRDATLNNTNIEETNIRSAITGGALEINSLTANDFAAGGGPNPGHRGEEIASAIAASGNNFGLAHNRLDPAVLTAFNDSIENVIDDVGRSKQEIIKAISTRFLQTEDSTYFFDPARASAGHTEGNETAALANVISNDPTAIRHFAAQVGAHGGVNHERIENVIETAVSTTMINTLKNQLSKFNPRTQAAQIRNTRAALETIGEAMDTIATRVENARQAAKTASDAASRSHSAADQAAARVAAEEYARQNRGGNFNAKHIKIREVVREL
jgi:hypothetical protein